jgi:UDP-N-acetylglucosamine--N-acetylmuramyl-(pentapeptide) pyrophosphoryl-undecaprenol N-acetylglucosamine transferase
MLMSRFENQLRIVLAGGATAGPIAPLLAVRESLLKKELQAQFFIADVAGSVGELLSKSEQIPFFRMRTGKLRRYFSWRTVAAPFLVLFGLAQAIYLLKRYKITHVLGAGGFVQVPLIWAAWLLRLRTHIHQQDIAPTLANSLCAPIAKTISVTFASSTRDFYSGLGLWRETTATRITITGNPCRDNIFRASRPEAQKFFQLDPSWPTVYILGGGSGAAGINKLVYEALPELTRTVQVIHSTGRGKHHSNVKIERYHSFEYISRQDLALAAADIVIGRAGVYMLTELSNLGKTSIIIPMPQSHQEQNARLLYEQQAALVLDQNETTPEHLVSVVRRLLFDFPLQEHLRQNIKKIMPHNSASQVAKIILTR